jgi:hypothetical protein
MQRRIDRTLVRERLAPSLRGQSRSDTRVVLVEIAESTVSSSSVEQLDLRTSSSKGGLEKIQRLGTRRSMSMRTLRGRALRLRLNLGRTS